MLVATIEKKKMTENKKVIDSTELTLDEFLNILFSNEASNLFPNNHFPTEGLLNEYLSTIHKRSDTEIRDLLRRFIICSSTFGLDEFAVKNIIITSKDGKKQINSNSIKTEYHRRLLQHFLLNRGEVWEGLTWTLDLLPNFPLEAIKAIDAYFLANCLLLPDHWLNALSDCTTIIRGRYINYEHPKEIFWNLAPKEFEFITAELYESLGYSVQLTQDSYDGGIDIHASKNEVSIKEKLVIQCKRYTKNNTVGVGDIRNLLGVVTDTKATKGVLITTSTFSTEAKKFENKNPSIELIDIVELNKLLNGNLGTYWIDKIDRIIRNQKSKKVYKKKMATTNMVYNTDMAKNIGINNQNARPSYTPEPLYEALEINIQ